MNAKKGIIRANFANPETLGSLANTTIAYAISQGITFNEISQAIDISELDYTNQDARLPDPVVGELMNMLIKKFPDRAISMEIAQCAPFSMLGGMVQGAMFATDVESALNWFVENSTVLADQAVLHLEKTVSDSAFVVSHPFEAMDQGHTLEATMGLIWRLLNTITQPEAPPLRVEFANKKLFPYSLMKRSFKHPFHFRRVVMPCFFH